MSWLWVLVAVIGGVTLLMAMQIAIGFREAGEATRKMRIDGQRAVYEHEHEIELAEMEREMFMAALEHPPTNAFQTRGRPIPDLLGRSAFTQYSPRVFDQEGVGDAGEATVEITSDGEGLVG